MVVVVNLYYYHIDIINITDIESILCMDFTIILTYTKVN